MARARPIEGLECEAAFDEVAALVVSSRLDEMLAHSSRAIDLEDVEPLHDMRVASRRLRSVLETFRPCFRPKRHRRAAKRLNRLAAALGERRDRDVAIAYLRSCLDGVREVDRPAAEELIGELRAEQRRANEDLAELLAPGPMDDLRASFRRLLAKGNR